jgi:hypothetical protein
VTEGTTVSQGNAELGEQSPDTVVDLRQISVVSGFRRKDAYGARMPGSSGRQPLTSA